MQQLALEVNKLFLNGSKTDIRIIFPGPLQMAS